MCNEVGKGETHKALESLSVRVKPFIVWELRAKPSAIQKMYLQKNSLILWVVVFFFFFSLSIHSHFLFPPQSVQTNLDKFFFLIKQMRIIFFPQTGPGTLIRLIESPFETVNYRTP